MLNHVLVQRKEGESLPPKEPTTNTIIQKRKKEKSSHGSFSPAGARKEERITQVDCQEKILPDQRKRRIVKPQCPSYKEKKKGNDHICNQDDPACFALRERG